MSAARPRLAVLLALSLAAPALAGCLGAEDADGGTGGDEPAENATDETPSFARPLPDPIAGVDRLTTLGPEEELDSGYQLELDGETAYVAAWNAGFYTVNVSDPADPEVLAHVPEHFGHDPRVLHYDDGRTFVALAGSGDGIAMIDVTDPRAPAIEATILGQNGTTDTEGANVHNIATVPGTHLIYNSRSVDTPGVDIVDASNPTEPALVDTFNDLTCHDVGFHPPDELAFCAGVRETQIWDVSDPRSPEILARIHNPAINIHHWAVPANDGDTLIIGDELAGAAHEAANSCALGGADNPATGGTTTDPVGALWFYDVSDPSTPTPVSYLGAGEMRTETGACTAHFGEVIDERDKLVVGFLSGGLYTVDFSDLQAPAVIDHDAVGEVVDLKVHHGYGFGVGRERGMDVWTFAEG